MDGVPEGWCPALAVWWSGGVAGVAYRWSTICLLPVFKDVAFVFSQPLIAGPLREGWARCIAATDQGSFSSSRMASGVSWLGERGKHE